jgi:hypothetical protein
MAPNGSDSGESEVFKSSEPNRHLERELMQENGCGAWLPAGRGSRNRTAALVRVERTAAIGERIARRPKRPERTALADELNDASARPAVQASANSE